LIKDVQALEIAHRVQTVAFDKTGTLTLGHPRLTQQVPAPGQEAISSLRWAASVQSGSEHPLAHAVVERAAAWGLALLPVAAVRSVAGRGTEGQVEGQVYGLGSLRWMQELGAHADPTRRLVRPLAHRPARWSPRAPACPRWSNKWTARGNCAPC